jgi:predicted ester cyclase
MTQALRIEGTEAARATAHTRQLAHYQQVWVDGLNRGDVSAADEAFAPDCIIHFTGMAEPLRGVEAWKQHVTGFLVAFPDLRFTMDEQVGDGDRLAHRWRCEGTHTAPLGPIPATGRRVAFGGVIIDHVSNGRVVERWEQIDQSLMMRQLGLG